MRAVRLMGTAAPWPGGAAGGGAGAGPVGAQAGAERSGVERRPGCGCPSGEGERGRAPLGPRTSEAGVARGGWGPPVPRPSPGGSQGGWEQVRTGGGVLTGPRGGAAQSAGGFRGKPRGGRRGPCGTHGAASGPRRAEAAAGGAAPCRSRAAKARRSCPERRWGLGGTAAAPAWGWAETEAASPRGPAAGQAASRGMPGAVVFADSAAGRQRGSRARRSPGCRRGPRSPTRSASGALPVSRGFPRASRCARSPTSRADAPPGRMRRPARGAARRSLAGSDPSGACAVPGSSVVARRAGVSAAAGERRDRG